MRLRPPSINARLFIFGFVMLLFEVIFTRVASAYFQYHYAFFILSIAMLSFCLSGILYQRAKERERAQIYSILTAFLPASLLILLFLLCLPFTAGFALPAILISIVAMGFGIPFICGFLTVSLLDRGKNAGLSYGANLLGSGAGGLAAVLLLTFGDPYQGLAACSIASLMGIRGAFESRKVLVFAAACLAISLPFLAIPIKNPDMVWEEWNAFSRVSVNNEPSDNMMWGKTSAPEKNLPASFQLTIDSLAATAIVLEPEKSGILAEDITHAGYHFLENGSTVAIIGSGGGRDAVAAKQFNLSKIKAIEINPLVIEAVESISPRTYEGVDVVVADGRESLAVSGERFDLVQLSLVDTWATVSSGSHALAENYLYTKESFGTYLDSLEEGGMVSISYWERYAGKFVSLASAALGERGVEDPSEHIMVLKQGWIVTILVKENPWSAEEREFAEGLAGEKGYVVLSPEEGRGVAVNTDDSPFFFFNEQGFLVLTGLLGAVSLVLYMAKDAAGPVGRKTKKGIALFFGLIGLGFMTVEAVFVQRVLLAVHNPTITVALVFTSFLVFSGIGSLIFRRVGFKYSLALVPMLLLFAFGWGDAAAALNGMDLPSKCAILAAIIAPFAILMGTFFPRGMTYLKEHKLDRMGDAWTINGMASVFAPILMILIAVYSGFTAALLLAAAAYSASWAVGMKEFGQ